MRIHNDTQFCPKFNAGLTKTMKQEITHCDVNKVSAFLQKQGIENNFRNNKTIAWCSLKCVQLIQHYNKLYNLKLELPKGIFVENFENLSGINSNAFGFANFAPVRLYKQKQVVVPEKTIFFNEFKNADNDVWSNIDLIADREFSKGIKSTDFFMEAFIHEFMHILHEQNLLSKIGGEKLISLLQRINKPENLQSFQTNYKEWLKQICSYATSHPLEAVACDLSKRAIKTIDKKSLLPQNNFLASGPYTQHTIFFYLFGNNTDRILSNIWNGKI